MLTLPNEYEIIGRIETAKKERQRIANAVKRAEDAVLDYVRPSQRDGVLHPSMRPNYRDYQQDVEELGKALNNLIGADNELQRWQRTYKETTGQEWK